MRHVYEATVSFWDNVSHHCVESELILWERDAITIALFSLNIAGSNIFPACKVLNF